MTKPKRAMSIFTDRFKQESEQSKANWKRDFLYSIATTGTGTSEIKPFIGTKQSDIIDIGSGRPRIHRSLIDKFKLIISHPEVLSVFNSTEIRCCLCHRVITYPSWYYSIRYAVNHFHHFVCADKQSLEEQKPNTHCYRR